MRKVDRFDKYMKIRGLNDNRVTVDLGLSVGTISKSRKKGRDLSSRVIEQILNYYRDLNKVWLLTGEGEMLVSQSSVDKASEELRNLLEEYKSKYLAQVDESVVLRLKNQALEEKVRLLEAELNKK